ncbi:aspartate racemase protein [Paraphaeosphaeria minitans]|uniref:Aspartate racemase protein n=1 Tax=Paraphaeosphaeria minitans TaxID=565426 RepID=A0A9P6GE65_9PLEO|nr:aspartate racemase protein [Paraphaeosphaeria minitans]
MRDESNMSLSSARSEVTDRYNSKRLPSQHQATPPLGFLAVQVSIRRPPGDPFHPSTWPFPLIHALVPGTSESQIVTSTAYPPSFIDRFVAASNELAERGCVGIITSCGFLALAQRELSERTQIPIATSALVQLPSILAILGVAEVVGMLTYDEERLGGGRLDALRVDAGRVRIQTVPRNGHLQRVIQKGEKYNKVVMEREIVDAAGELMPPYAEAIQRRVGVPVYHVYTMGLWFYSGLVRRTPERWKN